MPSERQFSVWKKENDDVMSRRKRTRSVDEETTYWLSYSDMMAGLLLTFVLVISCTMLHARAQYDEKQRQLSDKEEQISVQTYQLEEQKAKVVEQQGIMDAQQAELKTAQEELEKQKAALATAEARLRTQQDELGLTQQQLESQQKELGVMRERLDAQEQRLDDIIGVRSDLIEALKEEFQGTDLSITVDEKTGAITFDSSVLYDYGEFELKDSGKLFLRRFLPRYLDVLMKPKFSDYIAEIIIEGHTDTAGGYLYNLELSQKRALSVAAYCLDDDSNILPAAETELLRGIVTANGRSYSEPVMDEKGNVDADASRRVEFLFRLKDDEMVREMQAILNDDEDTDDN